jgi:lipopolysaccharide export system protein LptC
MVHGLPSWPQRLRQAAASYLPLLLMLLLALSTFWLVKNAPRPEEPRGPQVLRHEPDYTMQRFAVQRFGQDGRARGLLEGAALRHFPDTDTLEIDDVRLRAIGDDGRVTTATALRALSNADGSEVQLLGKAHVVSERAGEAPIEFESEFLHAFANTERVKTHLPVVVRQAGSVLHAGGMEYDNLSRNVRLSGRVQAQLHPQPRPQARKDTRP